MTDYLVKFRTPNFQATADTEVPIGPMAGQGLVGPVTVTWQTETVPPTAQPAVATLNLWDGGESYSGPDGIGQFLPLDVGDPASLYVWVSDDDGTTQALAFQGRVSDVAATIWPGGGVIYAITLSDLLADLAAITGPKTIDGTTVAYGGIVYAYEQIIEAEPIDFNWSVNATDPYPFQAQTVEFYDWQDTSLLDMLTTYIVHDIRGDYFAGGPFLSRWLTYDVDGGDNFPVAISAPEYVLQEYDPLAVSELAGVSELLWDATEGWYVLAVNEDYYDDHSGLVIDASQIARDVGEWRKSRTDNINRIDLVGLFDTGTSGGMFPTGPYIETVRRRFTDLEALYGVNSRTINSPLSYSSSAALLATTLLGPRGQAATEYSPTQIVVDWSLLSVEQKVAWGGNLMPAALNPALARPMAITGVPKTWRLAKSPVMFGRVMATTMTIELVTPSDTGGADSDPVGTVGQVRFAFTVRGMPPSAGDSITWAGIGSLSPAEPTWQQIDPTIRWVDLRLVED